MCGFIGIFGNFNNSSNIKNIDKSLDYIKHRGPDDRSTYFDKNISLGFQRLSIQDLSKNGNQPMTDISKRYVIVFNGEIYNFVYLRKLLLEKNYKFKSKTDTEVLLNLYIEFKEKCLDYLEGMFAFCIYDKLKKNIFLARDNFGIKPLYFVKTLSKNLLFGSELKAFYPFIKSEKIDWIANESKFSEQINFRSIAGNETLIKDVKKLNPGEYLFGKIGSFLVKKYYNYENHSINKQFKYSHKKFLDEVDNQLFLTVKKHMISDVPIGVALSGGLDSSLLVNYMYKKSKNINTFSVNFREKERPGSIIDESEYINYIQKKFSTKHKSITLTENNYKKNFLKCLWHNDEPINFPHTPGIFLLSKLAKANNVKVLLGGEGADELFAGYTNFLNQKLNVNFFSTSNFNSKSSVIKNYKKKIAVRENYIKNLRGNLINKKIKYSILTYLQSIENRLDKMSMANSIEFRVPFLDKKLFELSQLNNAQKNFYSKKYSKYLLRKIAEKYFKKKHIYRPKVGFSVPINNWMRNSSGFGEYVSILSEKKTLNRSIYNSKKILELIKNFKKYPNESHNYSNAGKIWSLLNLELWIRSFVEKKDELK